MECIPELFQNMQTFKDEGTVLNVLTEYNGNKVIMKLHHGDLYTDQALDVEDSMNRMIQSKLRHETPHLLLPIKTGSCDFKLIYKQIPPEKKLRFLRKWKLVRGMYLYSSAKSTEQSFLIKKIKEYKDRKEDFLSFVHDHSSRSQKDYDIYYSLYPYLPTLSEWVENQNLTDNFDFQIAFQVAQVLIVFAKHKIMHNSLTPDNIFILDEESTVEYNFPFKMHAIELKQLVFIGNYSLTNTTRNIELDKLCSTFGKCAEYTPNLDWFTFLMSFIMLLESKQSTQLRNITEGKFGENRNFRAYNNPCICDTQKCDTCKIDKSFLVNEFSSPEEFLTKQKESQDFIHYHGKMKRSTIQENLSKIGSTVGGFFSNVLFGTTQTKEQKQEQRKETKPMRKKKETFIDPSLFGEPE